MSRFWKWVSGDWWTVVTDGKTWGIYHPKRRHVWRYGLTKEDARTEARRRNSGMDYTFCKECGFTLALHRSGPYGEMECP